MRVRACHWISRVASVKLLVFGILLFVFLCVKDKKLKKITVECIDRRLLVVVERSQTSCFVCFGIPASGFYTKKSF